MYRSKAAQTACISQRFLFAGAFQAAQSLESSGLDLPPRKGSNSIRAVGLEGLVWSGV
jgi:hypothetical protein